MSTFERRNSKIIRIGDIMIGGGSPVAIQSMTNTDPHDLNATYNQIKELEAAGCELVRLTIPDMEACETIYRLKEMDVKIPLVADIHFDYRLALAVADAGIDKIRINPGNIGEDARVKAVADKCREKRIPIRIGINSGSLEKSILAKHGAPTPAALAESALYHASLLEKFDFTDIVISIKSSTVRSMIEANRIVASACNYPLHIGVTEAGRGEAGNLKSAIGIGTLLMEGIGDTVRVSLTDHPVKEIEAGRAIFRACGLSKENYINVVSCPTCGRTKIDLIHICEELEPKLRTIPVSRPMTVAVMGCVVNGPGEAAEADLGIAGGKGEAVLFAKGKIIRKIPEHMLVEELVREVKLLAEQD